MDDTEDQRVKAAVAEASQRMQYTCLKEEQKLCIEEFVKGKDIFVVLPTGFGKTACFACLPYAFDVYGKRSDGNHSIIIVISPLTALITDRVQSLVSRNVPAGFLDAESSSVVKQNVVNGMYSILFMSPELLVNKWRSLFSSSIYQARLVGLVIDEAHCVVKW